MSTELKWKRDHSSWVAQAPEGRYSIEGRSGRYAVWYYGDNRHAAQPHTMVASYVDRLPDAKWVAEIDHAKRTSGVAYTSAAFKKLVAAQQQVRLAIDAARRDGMEDVEGLLMVIYEKIDVTRDAVLQAQKLSRHDPREATA